MYLITLTMNSINFAANLKQCTCLTVNSQSNLYNARLKLNLSDIQLSYSPNFYKISKSWKLVHAHVDLILIIPPL